MNFFDLHCDTATEAMKCHAGLCGNGLQLDLDKWQSGRLCQSYAVFIPDTLRGEAAWQYFLKCSGYWKDCIENTPDMLLLRKPAEASAQWRQKKHTCFFSVEGGAVLAGRWTIGTHTDPCGLRCTHTDLDMERRKRTGKRYNRDRRAEAPRTGYNTGAGVLQHCC